MITQEDIEAFMEEVEASRRPPLTVPQMVEIFAETMRQEKNPEMSGVLVTEEFDEWFREYRMWYVDSRHYKPTGELKELADLVYVIYSYARARGFDLETAIERVHENNMSRCVWPDGNVKYREDGKILKQPNYPKPDLSDLVGGKHGN